MGWVVLKVRLPRVQPAGAAHFFKYVGSVWLWWRGGVDRGIQYCNVIVLVFSIRFIYSPSIFSKLHAHRSAITASECIHHAAEVKAFRAACSG